MRKAHQEEVRTDAQVAHFLARGRTAQELSKFLGLAPKDKQVWARMKQLEGHEVVPGPSTPRGESTYVAVPLSDPIVVPKRLWRWSRSGQSPIGMVSFPESVQFDKIRIIPLDGILYGDPAHDPERFGNIVDKIAREPNTFCFFNGDVIAAVEGGSQEQRERILLERTAEFQSYLSGIAHKILWAQQGCLEARSLARQGFDPLGYFCSKLGIPYFTEPVYIDIVWNRQTFTLWAMHGHSTAQLKGARMNSIRNPAKMLDHTHFIVGGHVGDALWNQVPRVCRNTLTCRLEAKEEFHIILGNFKQYLGTRAARRGSPPPSTDTIVLNIYPDGQTHVLTESGRTE